MPCRCDEYESGSYKSKSDDAKIKDLEMRLCRAQSVVKDMAVAISYNKVGFSIPRPLAERAQREMRELAVHKEAEAKKDAEEQAHLESRLKNAEIVLNAAKEDLRKFKEKK